MGRVPIAAAVAAGVAEEIQIVVAGARDIRDEMMMDVGEMILAMTRAVILSGTARQLRRRSAMIQTRSSTRMSAI